MGKYVVHGKRSCDIEPVPWPHSGAGCQRMGRTLWLSLIPNLCGSFLPEQVGKNSLTGSRWEGSGRVRQGKAFLALLLLRCTGRAALNISSYSTSVSQEPFLWSQWHLINIKLMWIKGNWGIYVSIPLYRGVWVYFCSHWFDIDTAPLAFMTWICV